MSESCLNPAGTSTDEPPDELAELDERNDRELDVESEASDRSDASERSDRSLVVAAASFVEPSSRVTKKTMPASRTSTPAAMPMIVPLPGPDLGGPNTGCGATG